MRLLFITQAVDTKHLALGFTPGWIAECAKHFESIQVICLEEGAHALPENVTVASLGKKAGDRTKFFDRVQYVVRFFKLLRELRGKYDAVFVHMNQEYVLLAGWYWRLAGIPIFLWRNHYAGSLLTNLAVAFCTKVFCTSRYSYTARFKKTVLMPVGTDAVANPEGVVERVPRSILSLGRITSSKNIQVIVEALGLLHAGGIEFTATIRGKVEPDDVIYLEKMKSRARELEINGVVTFGDAVPKSETHRLYRAHEIFVNASPSGMLDKTIFSASAYGCLVLASSLDFKEEAGAQCHFDEGDVVQLSGQLATFLSLEDKDRVVLRASLEKIAEKNTLRALGLRLAKEIIV